MHVILIVKLKVGMLDFANMDFLLSHISLASFLWDIGKENSPRCDGVTSGAFLFAYTNFVKNEIKMKNKTYM